MIIQTEFLTGSDARQRTIDGIISYYKKEETSLNDFRTQEVYFYTLFPAFNLSMFHSELNLKERHMSISRNIILSNQRIFHACYAHYEGGQPQDILYDRNHIYFSLRDQTAFQRLFC